MKVTERSMNWFSKWRKDTNSHKYPITIWIAWLFMSASILLLSYTYYRTEVLYEGVYGERYFKYYVIALVGIVFWSVVLRL